jgi:hypothetical protein
MKVLMRATLAGTAAGLIAFIFVGWNVYAVLWRMEGMDKVTSADNPGVVLGGVWCFGWGIISGAIAGLAALVLTSRTVWKKGMERARGGESASIADHG